MWSRKLELSTSRICLQTYLKTVSILKPELTTRARLMLLINFHKRTLLSEALLLSLFNSAGSLELTCVVNVYETTEQLVTTV